jgi:hypothetical protein
MLTLMLLLLLLMLMELVLVVRCGRWVPTTTTGFCTAAVSGLWAGVCLIVRILGRAALRDVRVMGMMMVVVVVVV